MREFMGVSLLTLLFWLGINGVEPLKNVQVVVPPAVTLGNQVTLSCLYDLELNESLYAVKWYLGELEFYRYLPKEVPPSQIFHIPGLEVDRSKSDAHNVVLKSVRHEQTGSYRCEVSADAPFFDTDMMSAQMTVVEFPENSPLIEVGKHRYEVGERIKANCSFGPSRPASNITWFINNIQVRDQYVSELPVFEDGNERAWVKSYLEIDTDVTSFRNGKLKLKCIANVYSIYHKVSEVQIEEEKPRSESVLGSKDSSRKTIIDSSIGTETVDLNEGSKSRASSPFKNSWSSVQILQILTIFFFLLENTLSSYSIFYNYPSQDEGKKSDERSSKILISPTKLLIR